MSGTGVRALGGRATLPGAPVDRVPATRADGAQSSGEETSCVIEILFVVECDRRRLKTDVGKKGGNYIRST